MKDSPIDLMVAAQKFGNLKEIEAALADRKRLVDAANKDLAAARVTAAKVKDEAAAALQQARTGAEHAMRKLNADQAAAVETHRGVLQKMQDDTHAVLDGLERAVENKRQLVAKVKKELDMWNEELGKVKSAFHDAKTALGL
jgi:3-oxoacyl-ACP reductase-like protein